LLLDKLTTKPPAGATLESVTVPVEGAPPITLVGLSETFERAGGLMVRVAVCVTAPAVAVIVAVVAVPTAMVDTVNVAVVAPWATVTLAGTLAAVLSDERVTVNPPASAGALNVTVPVALVPPRTEVGLTLTDASAEETTLFDVPALSNQAWPS
jgi:hypothetical protein